MTSDALAAGYDDSGNCQSDRQLVQNTGPPEQRRRPPGEVQGVPDTEVDRAKARVAETWARLAGPRDTRARADAAWARAFPERSFW